MVRVVFSACSLLGWISSQNDLVTCPDPKFQGDLVTCHNPKFQGYLVTCHNPKF